MVDPPQRARLITLLPQDAAALIRRLLRAGGKQKVDFDAPLRPALLHGIIL